MSTLFSTEIRVHSRPVLFDLIQDHARTSPFVGVIGSEGIERVGNPINQFLLDNIEPEVRQNVRRVNRHPSNVQWAGGNEIEGIVESANQTMSNGTVYLDQACRYRLRISSL